jgi:hypothetical protein
MNRLTAEPRAQILSMIVEGNSIRAIWAFSYCKAEEHSIREE